MAVPNDFVHEHVLSFVIRCSFCDRSVRKDVPDYDEQDSRSRHRERNTIEAMQREAIDSGWKTGATKHGVTLNFCPEHKQNGVDLGLIKISRLESEGPIPK